MRGGSPPSTHDLTFKGNFMEKLKKASIIYASLSMIIAFLMLAVLLMTEINY